MNLEKATLGAGCFWCVEAVFQTLKGVCGARSGYAGGTVHNPTYRQVCSGTTGHAEVVQVAFDPDIVSFAELLEVFWRTHDPTTLNRQGPDFGSQYRSAVYYHGSFQESAARKSRERRNASGRYPRPIVTEITPASTFYRAEEYHQQYLEKRGLAHCRI
jgi:peptide-methionine (S)-S-oxide reductase